MIREGFKQRFGFLKTAKWVKLGSLFIGLIALIGLGSLLTVHTLFAATNPIIAENQNPGTTDWRINYNIGTFSSDTNGEIKGYASATSVNKGDSINLHVSVNPAQTYAIDVFRMGWYGGAGGRLMQHIGPLNGTKQPDCPLDAQTGMIECQWAVGYTLAVPSTWMVLI